MTFFIFASRLKEVLGVETDKDVASLLGMKPNTYNNRKKKGDFPEREVLALKASRPELKIDMDYIFTGVRSSQFEVAIEQGKSSSGDMLERVIRMYLSLSYENQEELIRHAEFLRFKELNK